MFDEIDGFIKIHDGIRYLVLFDYEWCDKICDRIKYLTLKRLGGEGEGGGVNLIPPVVFSKIVSSKQRVKPRFFVTFKIIIRYIFPENFIEIPQVVQKL